MQPSSLPSLFGNAAVQDSEELQRIIDLPRRAYSEEEVQQLVRDYTAALKTPHGTMTLKPIQAVCLNEIRITRGLLAPVGVGHGKAIPDHEPVLLESGWTPVGQVRVGDRLYGADGQLHDVTGVYPQGVRPVFRLNFSDGSSALSDLDHLWTFYKRNGWGKNQYHTMTLASWAGRALYRQTKRHKCWSLFLPVGAPVDYPHSDLPLDPYTLGALLGDGGLTQGTATFTSMDDDIVAALKLPLDVVARVNSNQNSGRAAQYNLVKEKGRRGPRPNPLKVILDEIGLFGTSSHTKFIPTAYLSASIEQRVALLQGLLDTDGEATHATGIEWSSVSQRLVDDVRELVESLGGTATLYKYEHHERLRINMPAHLQPFRCAQKRENYRADRKQRPPHRSLRSIEPVGRMPCTCISTNAPDHLFRLRHHVLTHNTIVSLLAARIVGAKRPLLVIPASLREKTLDDIEALRRHWHLPLFLRVESYEFLSRVNASSLLTRYSPDILICDEAHRLKNSQAACTKRVRRYLKENTEQHEKTNGAVPLCRFVAMSGTLTKRSLKDYAHMAAWALRDLSPVPRQFPVLMEWCGALDEDGAIRTFTPGALERLGTLEDPVVDQNSARRAYRQRLRDTPGVVATDESALDVSIEIDAVVINDPAPPAVEAAMSELRTFWRLPDGHTFVEGVEQWRHARELALGFFYRWDPWPPEAWGAPRAAWSKALREILQNNRRNLDTDLQVRQALAEHPKWYPEATELWQEWEIVKPTFTPNTTAVWLSDHVIEHAGEWAQRERGIVWIEHHAFGVRFEQITGIPVYGEGGMNARGARIEHHPPGSPLGALISSNCTGRNLQAWNKNLIVSPPPSGNTVEQLLGRTHRPGQEADTVYATWTFGGVEHLDAFDRCVGDAEYVVNSTGAAQKILYADRTFDTAAIGWSLLGPLWVKQLKSTG